MYGNEMIGELGRRTDGRWRPSPGSVYPTVRNLVDTGLVVEQDTDGRRLLALTDAGREMAARLPARPWQDVCLRRGSLPAGGLQDELDQLLAAVEHAERVIDADQRDRVAGVLESARRAVYRVLAGSPPADEVSERLPRTRDGSD
jgi:DNA-binding PadR family transcriptional regulator